MIDNAVSQSIPSYIDRWGSCTHGLIHYYSSTPVTEGVTQLNKNEIKIVTHGGKVFYPFSGSTDQYTVYKYSAETLTCRLYQHPLSEIHTEDEHGRDWSGYALISSAVFTQINGIKTPHYNAYPVTPDDNAIAVYCGSDARVRTYGFPNPEEPDGVSIVSSGEPYRPATYSSTDGKVQITATPPLTWTDPLGSSNLIFKYTYSGSWPEIHRTGEALTGVNDADLYYYTSGVAKTLKRDTARPQIGVCYPEAADTSFKVKEIIDDDPFAADDSHRKETLTSLVDAAVDNDGNISVLKVVSFSESKYSASVSLTGSISAVAGGASDCATAQQPSGWYRYIGSSMSYTDTSSSVSSTHESTTLSGWGGTSEFVLDRATVSEHVTDSYEGDGTLEGYSYETSITDNVDTTMMFDGSAVDHGILNPDVTSGFTSTVKDMPWSAFDITSTYQMWWVYTQGTWYTDGGDVALVRVFKYRYSGDMHALAVGVAKGNISKIGNDYFFTMTSVSVKIGGVFAHGQYHAGSNTVNDAHPSLYGASNPKTGQIVRDMSYPVMYI